jgi:hypothetical protein
MGSRGARRLEPPAGMFGWNASAIAGRSSDPVGVDIVADDAGGNFLRPPSELRPNGFGAAGPGIESVVSGIAILADEGTWRTPGSRTRYEN